MGAVTFYAILREVAARKEDEPVESISRDEYNQEYFFGVIWRWHYIGNEVFGLRTFCRKCDYELEAQETYRPSRGLEMVLFRCEECGHAALPIDGTEEMLEDRVTRKIQHRLRNGTWRDIVEQKRVEEGEA